MTLLNTAGMMTGMALLGGLLAVNAQEKLVRPALQSEARAAPATASAAPVELQSSRDLTPGWWDTLGAPPSICPAPPEAEAPAPKLRKPQLNLPVPERYR